MRIFAFIFSIYFFALAIMPCKDGCHAHKSHPNSIELSFSSHVPLHEDICSPLCVCSCCGSIFVATKLEKATSLFEEKKHQTLVICWISPLISSYHGHIWQPPKINA